MSIALYFEARSYNERSMLQTATAAEPRGYTTTNTSLDARFGETVPNSRFEGTRDMQEISRDVGVGHELKRVACDVQGLSDAQRRRKWL